MSIAIGKIFTSKIKVVAIAAAFFITALASPVVANAQGIPRSIQCGNRDVIVKTLDQRFKENRFAMGLASNVSLLELFVSKRGTWTIITTRADGKTCIVASGKSWVSMPITLDGDAV